MDRAWDQLSQNYEAHRLIKRWTYSLEVSQSLFDKRFRPILEADQPEEHAEDMFLAIAFMAPLYQKLLLGDTSFVATVRQKPLPAAYSRSFTKIIRPGGPLLRRLNQSQTKGVFFEQALVGPPLARNLLYPSVTNLINYLESLTQIITIRDHRPGKDLPISKPTDWKDQELKKQGMAGYDAVKAAFIALQPHLLLPGIIFSQGPGNGSLYRTIANQISPLATLTARLQGLLAPAAANPEGIAPGGEIRLRAAAGPLGFIAATATPVFPEAMFAALAGRSTDYLLPGLGLVPLNRVALLKTNPAFIEAYLVGLNHEISREYLWREFPAPLDTTPFSQFWDERDKPADTASSDITAITSWGRSDLGTHQPANKVAEKMVVLIRGDLLQKYPHTEIFLQQANVPAGQAPAILYPLFSARIDPDLRFIGFNLSPNEALGIDTGQPPWLFVLKERAGEVHFGLDLDASATDPSWEALAGEVPEHSCINVSSPGFQALPRYTGNRADHLAAMLYQKPFMLLVPALRMVSQN
jgi:hypothetical protein